MVLRRTASPLKRPLTDRFWLPPVLALGLALLTGCASYRLGDASPAAFRSLHVSPVVSDTFAPQSAPLVTQAVLDTLMRAGTVEVGDAGSQATLTVTLTGYSREAKVGRPEDWGRGHAFDTALVARATLIDNRTGQILFQDREFRGEGRILATDELTQSEHQTMPLIARQLGEAIARAVLASW